MISYEFTQYVPKRRFESTTYAEECKVIQEFLEKYNFPTLHLSYPDTKTARNANTWLRKFVKSHKLNLVVAQRESDIYLIKKVKEN